jgi:hypothetical protein
MDEPSIDDVFGPEVTDVEDEENDMEKACLNCGARAADVRCYPDCWVLEKERALANIGSALTPTEREFYRERYGKEHRGAVAIAVDPKLPTG